MPHPDNAVCRAAAVAVTIGVVSIVRKTGAGFTATSAPQPRKKCGEKGTGALRGRLSPSAGFPKLRLFRDGPTPDARWLNRESIREKKTRMRPRRQQQQQQQQRWQKQGLWYRR